MSYSLEYLSGLENIFPVFTRMHGEIYISSYSFEKHLICPNKSLQWCPYGLPSIDRVILNLAKISWLEIVGFCSLWQQLVDIQSEKKNQKLKLKCQTAKLIIWSHIFSQKKKQNMTQSIVINLDMLVNGMKGACPQSAYVSFQCLIWSDHIYARGWWLICFEWWLRL